MFMSGEGPGLPGTAASHSQLAGFFQCDPMISQVASFEDCRNEAPMRRRNGRTCEWLRAGRSLLPTSL